MSSGTVPVTISVNVDVESRDGQACGVSGLFGRYSYGRYGAREGMWRLLRLFAEEGIAATFFFYVGDAERHPHLVDAAIAGGHEVAPQGNPMPETGAEADLDSIDDIVGRWTRLTGAKPAGWRFGNGLATAAALDRLAALGIVYDSTFEDDDRPWVLALPSGKLRILPVFKPLTDATFYAGRQTPARVRKVWREEAGALYSVGGYIHLTLHLRGDIGSTRAVRVAVVEDTIRFIRALPETDFLRCDAVSARLSDLPAEPLPDYPMHPPERAEDRIPAHLRRRVAPPATP